MVGANSPRGIFFRCLVLLIGMSGRGVMVFSDGVGSFMARL